LVQCSSYWSLLCIFPFWKQSWKVWSKLHPKVAMHGMYVKLNVNVTIISCFVSFENVKHWYYCPYYINNIVNSQPFLGLGNGVIYTCWKHYLLKLWFLTIFLLKCLFHRSYWYDLEHSCVCCTWIASFGRNFNMIGLSILEFFLISNPLAWRMLNLGCLCLNQYH
jgi:hypothetical protein